MSAEIIPTHPVQIPRVQRGEARVPTAVTMRAYEVYKAIYGPQEAMVTGECRGGFSAGELIAFLYAETFPRNEWRERAEEAFRGMKL